MRREAVMGVGTGSGEHAEQQRGHSCVHPRPRSTCTGRQYIRGRRARQRILLACRDDGHEGAGHFRFRERHGHLIIIFVGHEKPPLVCHS
jgi:hypothetical protein